MYSYNFIIFNHFLDLKFFTGLWFALNAFCFEAKCIRLLLKLINNS